MPITLDSDDLAATRTSLGLGTAATVNTGTTNATIPLLNANGRLDAARLGSGTADATTFLRGDGSFAAAGGGGAWELIGTQQASGSADNMIQTGLTGSEMYMVIAANITATVANNIAVRLGDSSGIDSGASDYRATQGRLQDNSGGSMFFGQSGSVAQIQMASNGVHSAASNGYTNAVFYISKPASGTQLTGVFGQSQGITNGGQTINGIFGGIRSTAITVDRVQIFVINPGNNPTMPTGSMTVFKMKTS
jgi:hypothetical protein